MRVSIEGFKKKKKGCENIKKKKDYKHFFLEEITSILKIRKMEVP